MSRKYKNASKILKVMGKSREMFTAQRQAEANEEHRENMNQWRERIAQEYESAINKDYEENSLIFVYGTLQLAHGNHRLIQDCRFVGTATTKEKYLLTASGIPYVSKAEPVSNVKGEVYELNSSSQMSSVDGLEGHPNWYHREIITVVNDHGKQMKAWIYFNEEDRGREVIEHGNYTRWCLEKQF
jgi:gamma-glutamylaminecyclotransferase